MSATCRSTRRKTTSKTLFATVGPVTEVLLMQDRVTGKSRGFGFVTMSTDQDAANAVTQFHGKTVEGRALTVNEARPREERSGGGGGGVARSYGGGGGYSYGGGGGGGYSGGGGGGGYSGGGGGGGRGYGGGGGDRGGRGGGGDRGGRSSRY